MWQNVRPNTTAAVTNPNSYPGSIIIQRLDGISAENTPGFRRETQPDMRLIPPEVRRLRGDSDDYRLAVHPILHRGAEGILEQLGDDVLKVHRDKGEGGVRRAVNDPLGTDSVVELADIGHEATAAVDGGCRTQGRVNYADVVGVLGTGCRAGARVEMGRAAEVEGDVLFGYETGADPSSEVLV